MHSPDSFNFIGFHSPAATCVVFAVLHSLFIKILHAGASLSLHLSKLPHVVHVLLH